MTRIVTDRLSTSTSFALAMFLALILNAKVKADCGDYVHVGARSEQQAITPLSQKSLPSSPFHGPSCKRHQAPYTPAPGPTQSQTNSDWLLMPANAVAAPDERISSLEPLDFKFLIATSFGIFHPPR